MKHITPPKNSLGTQLFLSNKYLISFGAIALLLTGCQTTPRNNWPTLSLSEADAYRQQLLRAYKKPERQSPFDNAVYTQPVNKTEACLLLSSDEQKSKPGFKAFWDGECKNGYAYGLGRDIAIADDGLHLEEISVYSDDGKNYGPTVYIDFQNKFIAKGIIQQKGAGDATSNGDDEGILGKISSVFKQKDDKTKGKEAAERYVTTAHFEPFAQHPGYTTVQVSFIYDDFSSGNGAALIQYPTGLMKSLLRNKHGVVYQMDDLTRMVYTTVNPDFYHFQIKSPSGASGGVGGLKTRLGNFVALRPGGTSPQPVNVPQSYFDSFAKAFQEADQLVAQAQRAQVPAGQMEQQYLAKVCNNPKVVVPKGLTKAKYLEVCTFEKKLSAEVDKSIAVAKKELAALKEKAAVEFAENEKKYREAQEHQARMNMYRAQADSARRQAEAAEAQADAAQWANMNASIANMSRTTNAMLQNTLQSTPQVYTPSIGSSTSIYYVNPVTPNVTTVKKLR